MLSLITLYGLRYLKKNHCFSKKPWGNNSSNSIILVQPLCLIYLPSPLLILLLELKNAQKLSLIINCGYYYKGEYNIPLRLYFNKKEGQAVNLHIYEGNHPEIELNVSFRDYLRHSPTARIEYALLKEELLKLPSSFQKNNPLLTGYNLGKDEFIRKVLQKTGFNRIRIMHANAL